MPPLATPWTRPPAVAGAFYPADPAALRATIRQLLDAPASAAAGVPSVNSSSAPKAIIAPHAGYVFSGPVAAAVYRTLARARGRVSRVVILGPSHRVAFDGIAASTASHFATPLGPVEIDRPALDALRDLRFLVPRDDAHAREHGIEVHLPFLIEMLGGFKLVPLVVGDASSQQTAQVIDRLWAGPETLVVISSDLSHYHPYDEAVKLDAAAARAIEELRPLDLAANQACGCIPIRGLLSIAARHQLRPRTLDLRNSADTAPALGSRDSVVGYGGWSFDLPESANPPPPSSSNQPSTIDHHSASSPALPPAHRATLLQLARRSIAHGLATGRPLAIDLDHYDATLRAPRATFVTLNLPDTSLRGCIGTLEARRPLVEDIAQNAFAAAFRDPRFPPVAAGEIPLLQIHLSLLTAPEPMTFTSESDLLSQLLPGVDGLILEEPRLARRGTFLPAVWETLPGKREFLEHLKQKAGLPPTYWSPTLRFSRYRAESID